MKTCGACVQVRGDVPDKLVAADGPPVSAPKALQLDAAALFDIDLVASQYAEVFDSPRSGKLSPENAWRSVMASLNKHRDGAMGHTFDLPATDSTRRMLSRRGSCCTGSEPGDSVASLQRHSALPELSMAMPGNPLQRSHAPRLKRKHSLVDWMDPVEKDPMDATMLDEDGRPVTGRPVPHTPQKQCPSLVDWMDPVEKDPMDATMLDEDGRPVTGRPVPRAPQKQCPSLVDWMDPVEKDPTDATMLDEDGRPVTGRPVPHAPQKQCPLLVDWMDPVDEDPTDVNVLDEWGRPVTGRPLLRVCQILHGASLQCFCRAPTWSTVLPLQQRDTISLMA